jgi:hypothetical protein
MSYSIFVDSSNNCQASCAAWAINFQARIKLATQAMAKTISITQLAKEHRVSRKFIYAQKEKAESALNQAFKPSLPDDNQILFYLPVTKAWIKQLVLALILICHSSYQGVIELFRDLFDYSICKGTIHNIVFSTLEKASLINQKTDLSKVRIGAHDEIFQGSLPVLVGCDVFSTYCYLLKLEESRDGTTWGTHLLDLSEKQKLNPSHTIADAASGLRKGQKEAWPDTHCHGDIFHALKEFSTVCSAAERRAFGSLKVANELEKKANRPKKLALEERQKEKLILKRLESAKKESERACRLFDELTILYEWLRSDIFAVIGAPVDVRKELFIFIIEQLKQRQENYPSIRSLSVYLENQLDDLLRFATLIEKQLEDLAIGLQVSKKTIEQLYLLQSVSFSDPKRWYQENLLRQKLKGQFHIAVAVIHTILEEAVRASSIVENLNSRLRNYFFLRKTLGKDYLSILQFFLNHRVFLRSECPERVGKSPAELLTGQEHPHWLEMLDFELFKQAA